MSKHRIAVISDTHNKLRSKALDIINTCDLTLHAGDVTKPEILDDLNDKTDLTVIRGNCDRELSELPDEKIVDLFGKKIYMVHNKNKMSSEAKEADIIIYGHSHIYNEEVIDDQLYLNPGSAGPRRFGRPASMAIMEIDTDDSSVNIEKIDLNEE